MLLEVTINKKLTKEEEKELNVEEHEDWDAFLSNENRPRRVWLLTTKSERCFWNVKFQEGDGLLFGIKSDS